MPLTRPTYPVTGFEPAPLADLASRAERERLSGPALRGFFNLMGRWSIRDEDARLLLGGISNGPYYNWKKQPNANKSRQPRAGGVHGCDRVRANSAV